MAPLVADHWLPKAARLEPAIAEWTFTNRVDDALALTDLMFAFANNVGNNTGEECKTFEDLGRREPEFGGEALSLCRYTLGREPPPKLAFDAAPRTLAERTNRIRINYLLYQETTPGDADDLLAQLEDERSPRGHALRAVTASCLLHGESDLARKLAQAAVDNEPSTAFPTDCTPWGQLISLERSIDQTGARRVKQAWLPWDIRPLRGQFSHDEVLAQLQRAYVVTPGDTSIADALVEVHLRDRDYSAASAIVSDIGASKLPLYELEEKLLSARINAAKARFDAAFTQLQDDHTTDHDAGWMRAQRFDLAWSRLELAILLGKAGGAADAMVHSFLDAEPPRIDLKQSSVVRRLAALCVRSSTPERCFQRLDSVLPRLLGVIDEQTKQFIAGARCYARHELEAAADQWQSVPTLCTYLDAEMVDAFEQTGKRDLADKVDDAATKRDWEYHGATLGDVRAARRARKQGHPERALELADKVITAWGEAQGHVPTLDEMRDLASQLRQQR
jgi:hypothetical protein